MVGREHEADADLVDALRHLRRAEVDVDPERLERVGAARLRGHGAPAVLGHPRASGGSDEYGRGRDVERARAVAAGADHVDQIVRVLDLDPGRELAHHLGGGGDLAYGFLLHPQRDGDRRDHHRRHLPAHDLAHQIEHLVVENLAMLDHALQRFLWRH